MAISGEIMTCYNLTCNNQKHVHNVQPNCNMRYYSLKKVRLEIYGFLYDTIGEIRFSHADDILLLMYVTCMTWYCF